MWFASPKPAREASADSDQLTGSSAGLSLPNDGWHKREEAVMGTAISVELWSADTAKGEAAIDAVMAEMHRIDRTMSPHKPTSELSCINRHAAQEPVQVSHEMFLLIARARQFSEMSGGAFDITYASAGQLYDYRLGLKPDDEMLARAVACIGYQNLILDAKTRTIRFAREGVRIDLGGFAKGHAVDNSITILKRLGIRHASVAAGGDSHVIGNRGNRPWTVGVRDPRRANDVVAVLPLQDVAISTSGDYERYFELDGERCHHLLDPKTGKSPCEVRSVTILADDGLTTEALSKCVFVMGVEKGLAFIDSMVGIDAIVVDAQGRLHYSNGLADGMAQASPPSAH